VTEGHIKEVRRALQKYQKYILFKLDNKKSIQYFNKLQRECSVSYYKKQMYQILKYLKHLKCDWVEEIQLPRNPVYTPIRFSSNDIKNTISFFQNTTHLLQIRALILLGVTSGLRAEELYQLNPEDINLQKRIVRVNHNPENGQTTKTQHSRVSFFTPKTQSVLQKYLLYYNNECTYSRLFPQTTLTRLFSTAPIRVKHLRKYFSQEWDRQGGPTSIKKLLMGHSLKGDVDLMHYNFQSEEDLKRIYDNVMIKHTIK